MDKKLLAQAAVKYLAGLVAVSILLFLPAGTLGYPNGWLFVGVLFVPMLITGLVLAAKNPELLRKRLDAKEKQQEQKGLITFSALMFVAGFVLAGLDFRFGWLSLPGWVSYAAAAVFLLGYKSGQSPSCLLRSDL